MTTATCLPASITANRVSVLINTRWRSFPIDSPAGRDLVVELKKSPHNVEAIALIADTAAFIIAKSFGRVSIDTTDQLRLDNEVVDYGLAGKLVGMLREGYDVSPLTNYIERVAENPNKDIAERLHGFIVQGNLPFAPDGRFYAWKNVRDDLFDFYSGTVHYEIGTTVTMPRENCDETRNGCRAGLHACSYSYLPSYHGGRGRTLLLLIDPKDVTSVPEYGTLDKLRCCALDVVAEVPWDEVHGHLQTTVEARYVEPSVQTPDIGDDEDFEIPPTEEAISGMASIDGAEAAEIADECRPDPYNASNFNFDWPLTLRNRYASDFITSFVHTYALDDFHSELAKDMGVEDGLKAASIRQLGAPLDCNPYNGARYSDIPGQHDEAYFYGFVCAFIDVVNGLPTNAA